jgi:hypothetical protein
LPFASAEQYHEYAWRMKLLREKAEHVLDQWVGLDSRLDKLVDRVDDPDRYNGAIPSFVEAHRRGTGA